MPFLQLTIISTNDAGSQQSVSSAIASAVSTAAATVATAANAVAEATKPDDSKTNQTEK